VTIRRCRRRTLMVILRRWSGIRMIHLETSRHGDEAHIGCPAPAVVVP